jgi:hypothetical protein
MDTNEDESTLVSALNGALMDAQIFTNCRGRQSNWLSFTALSALLLLYNTRDNVYLRLYYLQISTESYEKLNIKTDIKTKHMVQNFIAINLFLYCHNIDQKQGCNTHLISIQTFFASRLTIF